MPCYLFFTQHVLHKGEFESRLAAGEEGSLWYESQIKMYIYL